jgi:hypothetical protein
MNDMVMYMYGFFALLAVAGLVTAVKTIDWLISQKYVSHTKCEKCRSDIYKTIATDHDLLNKVDGKLDLVLDCMDIQHK